MTTTRISEQIINDINEGKENAFSALYDCYYSYLCAYATTYVFDPDEAKELIAFQEEFCKNDNNPLQLLEIEELKSQVNTVIDSLSVKCRLVFEKYLYEGMSPQEIADEQAISVNTVRVHIKNAMDHIKLQLGPTAGILFLFLYGRL